MRGPPYLRVYTTLRRRLLSTKLLKAPLLRRAPLSSEALDKLAKLKSLLDAGLITQEEFEKTKATLLRS
jgi:hypothetical protein